jgi:hypothetical protein
MLRTIALPVAMLSAAAPLLIGAAPIRVPVSHYRAVPFVGCASDGQQGPQPAPDRPAKPLPVWTPALSGLALYEGSDLAVLAPAGWHCLELEGSNGSAIVVTPQAHPGDFFFTSSPRRGPIVQLAYSFGGTSGRFDVAEVAARMFPIARDFVKSVEAEGLRDTPFATGPYRTDRIVERSATRVRYVTPPGRQGLGTRARLAPSDLPIDGLEILKPGDDMDLVSLAMRLPPSERRFADPIVAEVDRRLK